MPKQVSNHSTEKPFSLGWDQLCLANEASFSDIHTKSQLTKLKNNPPKIFEMIARLFLVICGSDPALRKFLAIDWRDAVDILHDVLLRNLAVNLAPVPDNEETPIINRQHAQQPCTAETAQRRCTKIAEYCQLDDPILILGDDDFIGLLLAKRGFQNVTSVDIDPYICQELEKRAQNLNLPLRVIHHDLRLAAPEAWRQDYKLIMIDPMYSIQGLEMFLSGAMDFLAHNTKRPYIFLNIHLLSLLRQGLADVPRVFSRFNLDIAETTIAFNRYPIPTGLNFFLSLFNRTCLRTDVMLRRQGDLGYFVSDALILRANQRS